MNGAELKKSWDADGYVVLPRLLGEARVKELREACDSIFGQWLDEAPDREEAANSTNMAFLTARRFLDGRPERRAALLNAVADENLLDALAHIFGAEPLFFNTQYFFEPASRTRAGDWHRDQQFDAPDEETERLRMRHTTGVHAHMALLADDNLEFVPGSHARWDTPEELRIRKGLGGAAKNSPDMPRAARVRLGAGDVAVFSAWGIHRGNYVAGVPRRTFDAIYSTAPGWLTPPPTCFLDADALDGLTTRARAFFSKFVETYKDKWLRGDYELSVDGGDAPGRNQDG